jgi:hypothetical protein
MVLLVSIYTEGVDSFVKSANPIILKHVVQYYK